jgi:cysteine desulfurase/selenocysteine lyase
MAALIDSEVRLNAGAPLAQARRSGARGAPLSPPSAWRAEFPALHQRVNGCPLVYLDNAATTHKPRAVLAAMARFYEHDNANVHRGVHALSQRATEAFEGARARLAGFLGAGDAAQIVFVRGATEAINLVAQSFARPRLARGDEILVSAMEHHSNLVPWQQLCRQAGAVLRVVPLDADGALRVDEFERLLGPRTRLAALTHVSNALGSVNDVARLCAVARARSVPVLLDGAQAVAHLPVDVCALGCDFYVFSGHKCYGPTGIGVLYGRREHLEQMPPWQYGGDMVRQVRLDETEFMPPPHRFEAGTPDIAGAVGLAAAADFLCAIGRERVAAHESEVLAHASAGLARIPGARLIGTARHKAGVLSFVLEGVHPHDVGTVLDGEGIAVRTGHHCAMPAMDHFGLPGGTARASFALYNTIDDAERFVAAVARVRRMFA